MAMPARILGDVHEEDLRRALDSVCAAHPLMGSRIAVDDHHDLWFSTDQAQKPRLRTVPRRSKEQWFEEVRQEYLVPFKPLKGPLIRFVLVYSEEVSELIAFSQHSICDGVSLVNLLRDILASYANPAERKQAIRPPSTTDYLKDYRIFSSNSTVTSALTAAFLAAFQEIRGQLPENRRTIQVPFDLRSRLGVYPDNFLGFFVGAFKFPFSYDFKRAFWKNAQELQEIIGSRAKLLDTSAIDMEPFDPTLVDAFTNCAHYVDLLPEAFVKTENLMAFSRKNE